MEADVAVVGAGPAGLFAAIAAAERGARTLVIERMATPGRKLLVSGSGQCNLTHAGAVSAFVGRYGPAGKALRPALYGFSNEALVSFFAERGVPLEEAENGKIFPVSRRAKDVLDALSDEMRRLGIRLIAPCRVLAARTESSGFLIETDRQTLSAGALIIATGGRSFPKTGSTGDGYALAEGFGHRIAEPKPALTPVLVESAGFGPFAACAGIALRGASVSVFRAGRKAAEGRGDVLFTHRGLSGPGILDLSRSIAAGDLLRVSLAPGCGSAEEADAKLLAGLAAHGKRSVVRVLRDFGMPDSLARALLSAEAASEEATAATLPKAIRRAIALAMAEGGDAGRGFPVAALGGWDEAMATSGGVVLSEIDPKRMESRLVPGLFFAGEVLDIDGDTGGFNIQAACSTGVLAGSSAAHRKN